MLLSTADSRTFPPEAGFIQVDVSGRGLAEERSNKGELKQNTRVVLLGSFIHADNFRHPNISFQEQEKGIFTEYFTFKAAH